MQRMPKLSVITVSYNHADFIEKHLNSIAGQSYQDFEWIIIDNASTDMSWEIIVKTINRKNVKHLIRNNSNVYFCTAFNQGLTLATGELIIYTQTDDYFESPFFENEVNKLDSLPNVGLVHTKSSAVDSKGKILYYTQEEISPVEWRSDFQKDYIHHGPDDFRRLLICNFINATSVMVRRVCYEKTGGLNPKFKRKHDWAKWLEISLLWDIAYIAKPLALHRVHSKNLTTTGYTSVDDAIEGYLVLNNAIEKFQGVHRSDNIVQTINLAMASESEKVAALCVKHIKRVELLLVCKIWFSALRFYPRFTGSLIKAIKNSMYSFLSRISK
jgi:glycosyltransferase involved in cell wall biosynthesis